MKKNTIPLKDSLDDKIETSSVVIIDGEKIDISNFENLDMTKYHNNIRMEIPKDDIDEFLNLEDQALEREKRRIPKIHGAKERRYIP